MVTIYYICFYKTNSNQKTTPMKKLTFSLVYFLGIASLFSQVTSVNYQLKFNTSTCMYDFCILIESGETTSTIHRIQFNSQISIVVPTGSVIEAPINHMPLQNNSNYTGTVPQPWTIASIIISPECQPESDFYGIIPQLYPTSHFNNLTIGDTVLLFSLPISPITDSDDIRIFIDGIDPDSSGEGMQGSDFSNGFTMGSSVQLFNTIATQVYPPMPIVSSCTYGDDQSISFWLEESCFSDTVSFNSCTNNIIQYIENEIEISSNTVIIGNGTLNTILDGGGVNRIFNVLPGNTLTLSNIKLQNCFNEQNGGAILNNGTLILDNVLFENNYENNYSKALTNLEELIIKGNTIIK